MNLISLVREPEDRPRWGLEEGIRFNAGTQGNLGRLHPVPAFRNGATESEKGRVLSKDRPWSSKSPIWGPGVASRDRS